MRLPKFYCVPLAETWLAINVLNVESVRREKDQSLTVVMMSGAEHRIAAFLAKKEIEQFVKQRAIFIELDPPFDDEDEEAATRWPEQQEHPAPTKNAGRSKRGK